MVEHSQPPSTLSRSMLPRVCSYFRILFFILDFFSMLSCVCSYFCIDFFNFVLFLFFPPVFGDGSVPRPDLGVVVTRTNARNKQKTILSTEPGREHFLKKNRITIFSGRNVFVWFDVIIEVSTEPQIQVWFDRALGHSNQSTL